VTRDGLVVAGAAFAAGVAVTGIVVLLGEAAKTYPPPVYDPTIRPVTTPIVTSRDMVRSPLTPTSPYPPSAAQAPSPNAKPPRLTPSRSVTLGPAVRQGKTTAGLSVWDRIAACESSGNWSINTGNGYYGGLQEDLNFWRSYGNPAYPRPDLAPKSAQIAAAVKARDGGRGYTPWPVCGRRA
jgi:hypothetical protein